MRRQTTQTSSERLPPAPQALPRAPTLFVSLPSSHRLTAAMNRLGIPVLPSIVNALVLLSVFSTGNAAVYTTSRAITALSLRGGAPAIFKRQNRNGVPYVSVIAVLAYSCISYLSVSNGSVKVLTWFTSIVGGANLVNWVCIAV